MDGKMKYYIYIGMVTVLLVIVLLALTGCRDPFDGNPWLWGHGG